MLLNDKIGIVTASPVANSVLGRLKSIADNIGSGGLTDAELRATAVPVSVASLPLPSGASTAANQQTDGLTDTEIRATALPISASSLPLPSGAATAAKQLADGHNVVVTSAPTTAVTGTFFQATQPVSATSLPLPSGAATAALQSLAAQIGPADPTIDSYTSIAINLTVGADQVLVAAPGANKQIWVYGVGFTVSEAGTVSFQDEDDTAITGIMPVTVGMNPPMSGNFSMPMWKLATNKALEVDIVTCDVDGWLTYAIVSV